MTILSMLAEALQAVGGGLIIKSSIDLGTDRPLSSYDAAAGFMGIALWIGGVLVERKDTASRSIPLDQDPDDKEPIKNKIIKKSLLLTTGFGVIDGLTQWGKGVDKTSANLSLLASGIIAGLALRELKATQRSFTAPIIPWEKTRFFITFLADNLFIFPMKRAVNKEAWDALDWISLTLGLGISIGEAIYSKKYDDKISLKSLLTRV